MFGTFKRILSWVTIVIIFFQAPITDAQDASDESASITSLVEKISNYPKQIPVPVLEGIVTAQLGGLNRNALRNFFLSPTGQRFLPTAESMNSLDRAYSDLRGDVTKTGLQGTLQDTLQDTLSFMVPTVLTQLEAVSKPYPDNPISIKLAQIVGAVSQESLATLCRPDITLQELDTFAAAARTGKALDSSAIKTILTTSRAVLQPTVMEGLAKRSLSEATSAAILDMIQQKAREMQRAGTLSRLNDLRMTNPETIGRSLDALQHAQVAVKTLGDIQDAQANNIRFIGLSIATQATELVRAVGNASKSVSLSVSNVADAVKLDNGQISRVLKDAKITEDFINVVKFGNVSTSVLVKIVQGGVLRDVGPIKDIADHVASLSHLQQQAGEAIKGLLTQGNSVISGLAATLSGKLAVPASILGTADSVKQIQSFATSIATGNYLGALTSLTGPGSLFGSGGSSGDQQVLQQISQINAKLDRIFETQQVIIKALGEIQTSITALQNLVVKTHAETMVKLDQIERRVLVNQKLLTELVGAGFSDCLRLSGGYEVGGELVSGILARPTYAERKQIFDLRRDSFERCEAALDKFDSPPNSISQLFYFETTPVSGSDIDKYLSQSVRPLFEMAKRMYTDPKGTEDSIVRTRVLAALLSPSISAADISRKYSGLLAGRTKPFTVTEKVANGYEANSVLDPSALLHYQRVSEASRFAATLYPIGAFVHPESRLFYTQRELGLPDVVDAGWTGYREQARIRLLGASRLLDIAIIEQAALNGDILIPEIVKSLSTSQALDALKSNAILAKNVVRYLLRDRLLKRKMKAPAFNYALNWSDSSLLRQVTAVEGMRDVAFTRGCSTSNDTVQKNAGWLVELGPGFCVEISSGEDILRGNIELSSALLAVLQAKRSVMNALADIEVPDQLSKTNRRTLANLIVAGTIISSVKR